MKEQYHHGDLRRALIETGLRVISEEGEENLSFRKAAARCGVSSAAPYAHFRDKEEFIGAIQRHVMESFTAALEAAEERYAESPDLLARLGAAYVTFFCENPLYYDFLFSRKNIEIRLSAEPAEELPPLAVLNRAAARILGGAGLPEEEVRDKVLAMWALVHGLAAILIMPGVAQDACGDARVLEIVKSVSPLFSRGEGEG